MTANDKRANRRVPVALRIRLRYQQVDQFISKFAVNISRGGMFLSSRNPKPVGTRLQFEMRLLDDSPVIEGIGEVRWIREYDRSRPGEPHGMGIEFIELKPESRALIERIIEHRRTMGGEKDDDAIPDPRAPRGQAAASAAGPGAAGEPEPPGPEPAVSEASGPEASAPEASAPEPSGPTRAAAQEAGEAAPAEEAAPKAAAQETTAPEQVGEPAEAARTSPPRPSRTADLPLPPELPPPRPRAPRLAEPLPAIPPPRRHALALTREVLGAIGAEPDAGMVEAALARARQLAGAISPDELDGELAALLRDPAAPEPVTVDAASRELSERLGCAPVVGRRRRELPPLEVGAPPADGSADIPIDLDDTGGAEKVDPADVLEELEVSGAEDVDLSDLDGPATDAFTAISEPEAPHTSRGGKRGSMLQRLSRGKR